MRIDSSEFGSIVIDGKKYSQVLIVDNEVIERNEQKLERLFATTHRIGDWEIQAMVGNKPDYILIGTGQHGVMNIDFNTEHRLKECGAKLIIKPTPEAVEKFNQLAEKYKVNALIHTTC